MTELRELHDRITQEITEERNQEMAESIEAKRAVAKAAKPQEKAQLKALKEAGLDFSKLDALDREVSAAADKEVKAAVMQMEKESQEDSTGLADLEIESTFLPDNAFILKPAWSAVFSDNDDQDKLIDASSAPSQAILTGGGCKDYWNSASGGGWGCVGGRGEIQSWVEFGFWFRPPTNKFYSVNPFFRFRGFYIVRADDGIFTCKSARVVVSAWTNVHQYNWKGWNHVNVLNVGSDEINVNKRFDADRHTYNSYLLGAGDWAWIRCTIGLYAYAKGGGSHAKNDFSTGNANYLCVPHCHVY